MPKGFIFYMPSDAVFRSPPIAYVIIVTERQPKPVQSRHKHVFKQIKFHIFNVFMSFLLANLSISFHSTD